MATFSLQSWKGERACLDTLYCTCLDSKSHFLPLRFWLFVTPTPQHFCFSCTDISSVLGSSRTTTTVPRSRFPGVVPREKIHNSVGNLSDKRDPPRADTVFIRCPDQLQDTGALSNKTMVIVAALLLNLICH